MKKFRNSIISIVTLGFPTVLLATGASNLTNPPADANALLNKISEVIVNPIIYMMFTAAFIVFIWGLVQFVSHLDNEESRSVGGKHMVWGLIGMTIMISVNAIIDIIQNTIRQLGG